MVVTSNRSAFAIPRSGSKLLTITTAKGLSTNRVTSLNVMFSRPEKPITPCVPAVLMLTIARSMPVLIHRSSSVTDVMVSAVSVGKPLVTCRAVSPKATVTLPRSKAAGPIPPLNSFRS